MDWLWYVFSLDFLCKMCLVMSVQHVTAQLKMCNKIIKVKKETNKVSFKFHCKTTNKTRHEVTTFLRLVNKKNRKIIIN